MRVSHFIKPNKVEYRPTRIILFDTETKAIPLNKHDEKHVLRLGVACFWRRRGNDDNDSLEWTTFALASEFWDWVVKHSYKKTTLILSSHNLSFDLPVLHAFKHLPSRGFKLTSYYCKGRTTTATFRCKERKLVFVDTTNFFPESLKELAPLVNLRKMEVDFTTPDDDVLEEYCRQDVLILVKLWEKWFNFVETHNLGAWKKTLPSQAFTAFRHRFMKHKILIHDDEKACKLERASYHGGRVEVLRIGEYKEGPYYKLDVNSMYPYVMHKYSYPIRLYRLVEPATLSSLFRKLKVYHVIADCLIRTPEPAFPKKVSGHIAYPVGMFRTVLTTQELKYLLTVGKVLQVYRLAYYSSARTFTEYVDYFYSLKQEYDQADNQVFRAIVKGFLNYLYGKFGQRGLKDTMIGECSLEENKIVEVYDVEKDEYYDLIYLAGQIIKRISESESYNSFPAIAAEVTANARLYLYSLIKQAGRQHVFYVDTDSLIVDREGFEALYPLVHDSNLGALRMESISERIGIRCPKDYTFGNMIRTKGIKSSATRLGISTYKQTKFPSISGLLRKGNLEEYIVSTQIKHLSRQIHSGNVGEDGRIIPFQLPLSLPVPSSDAPPPP